MSFNFNYGFEKAQDLLAKTYRDKDAIFDAINSQDEDRIADSIFSFSVTAYHIKDWLKEEKIEGVEKYIDREPMLRLCADLCNGIKHKIQKRPKRETIDPVASIDNDAILTNSLSLMTNSPIPINGFTVYIELKSGKQIDILVFANDVINCWVSFFNEKNI